MKVLHIINSYGGTEVYKNLIIELDRLGVSQTVYAPLSAANRSRLGNHSIDFAVPDSRILYSTVLNRLDRFVYVSKIIKCVRDLEKRIDIRQFDIIHAGMLLFDGAIAYRLSLKYNIPYISAIRGTDTLYYNKLLWHRPLFRNILQNAAELISISPHCIADFVAHSTLAPYRDSIKSRTILLPNGIDKLFLDDIYRQPRHLEAKKLTITVVAAYQRNKGIKELAEAIIELNDEGYDITLEAIGDGLPYRSINTGYVAQLRSIAASNPAIHLLHYMNKEGVKQHLLHSDLFAMPARKETFGLVYVEALTQGIPIIYSKNDGFDGIYQDGTVGYSVTALDKEDIKQKIKLIHQNYATLTGNIRNLNLESTFRWSSIAQRYYNIYKNVTHNE